MAKVAIVFGSESDREKMKTACEVLDLFSIEYTVEVLSAHRNPEKVMQFARSAESSGYKVIIAGAGMAAHLAGAIAANTTLPVIGVPIESSSLGGLDALLSTVQMPSGVPVATMAIGKAGAKNAAIFAVEILALCDENLRKKLKEFRGLGG